MSSTTIVDQLCKDCGKPYPATHVQKGGRDIDVSQGYCTECLQARIYKPIQAQCRICGKHFTGRCMRLQNTNIFKTETCPECSAKIAANEKFVEQALVAAIRMRWRQESGVSPLFMHKDFHTFDLDKTNGNTVKIHKLCKDYAANFPALPYSDYIEKNGKAYPSLVLFSTLDMVGVGKTHLVSAIAHHILDRWKGEGLYFDDSSGKTRCKYTNPVNFICEYELYRKIQQTYSYSYEEKVKNESEADIINRLIWSGLLIIDDIGKEPRKDMDFVQRTLFSIIDGRYKLLRPIVLTSNKTPDELAVYLGEASFDRIYEMCQGKINQVMGKSYRVEKGKER